MGQLNAMCDPGLNPGPKIKDIISKTTDKIWVRSTNSIAPM